MSENVNDIIDSMTRAQFPAFSKLNESAKLSVIREMVAAKQLGVNLSVYALANRIGAWQYLRMELYRIADYVGCKRVKWSKEATEKRGRKLGMELDPRSVAPVAVADRFTSVVVVAPSGVAS